MEIIGRTGRRKIKKFHCKKSHSRHAVQERVDNSLNFCRIFFHECCQVYQSVDEVHCTQCLKIVTYRLLNRMTCVTRNCATMSCRRKKTSGMPGVWTAAERSVPVCVQPWARGAEVVWLGKLACTSVEKVLHSAEIRRCGRICELLSSAVLPHLTSCPLMWRSASSDEELRELLLLRSCWGPLGWTAPNSPFPHTLGAMHI